jgi:hypothetical protein
VLIVADYLELEDLVQNEHLNDIAQNSSLGFVSGRQTGKASANKAKMIIGSSKRLEIGSYSLNTMRIEDSNAENIQLQNVNIVKQQNKNDEYNGYLGYLGNTLGISNKKTCIIGNSDTTTNNRVAILIPMNKDGLVDFGDMESPIVYDVAFPGGKRTDYSKLLELYQKYYNKAD